MGTISAHLRGITKSERRGRPPKFTVQQEQVLLDLIFQLASWYFPLSISEVIEMAGQYALTLGLKETNLVGFLALNVVSGAASIVCQRAFKLTKYLTYIFAGAASKIMKISLITL